MAEGLSELLKKLEAVKLKSVAGLEFPETGFAINGAVCACIMVVKEHFSQPVLSLAELDMHDQHRKKP